MKLSIVTVTYNAEASIEKTIKSVLNQQIPVYEYIIIDGKSTDKTNDIVEVYRAKFEERNIKFLHISEKDKGISDAFNKGIERASGDVVGLINSDDELLYNTNKILVDNYDDSTDVFYGNCEWIDEKNGIKYERKAQKDLSNIRYEMVMIHPSTFIKKSAYSYYGNYDITYRYCMDEELLTRFYENGAAFKYIDEKLTKFRAGGVSDITIKKTLKEGIQLALCSEKPRFAKTYIIYFYKYMKYNVSKLLKKVKIYKLVKKDVKKI